jgi:4-hydroxy-tetrahydrodipicolinate synthase
VQPLRRFEKEKGLNMNPGCYTALVTPFHNKAARVDEEGLQQLVRFQIDNGITGILAVGTTGESPTLVWDEHNHVIDSIAAACRDNCACIAGTGSNNTRECLIATEHAASRGVQAVLLVDPYYNGPSSLEIRREYVAPVAKRFPELTIIPYVIPGRTGAQLFPEDLALLYDEYDNVNTVKEATGNLDNMRRTRACCGPDFTILSGDDGLTLEMMTDPGIAAAGVISVVSNIAPAAVTGMVTALRAGDLQKATRLAESLAPLFGLVTVTTREQTPHGEVTCRARNPLAIKSLMSLLGMPSGGCRRPLGKMSAGGLAVVLDAARTVFTRSPEILQPAADFFNIDIEARLNDKAAAEKLIYSEY